MSFVNIPLSDLESKKKQLESQLQKIQEELGHIDWVIRTYKGSDVPKVNQTQLNVGKIKVEDFIVEILKDRGPAGLSADELLKEMENRGRSMNRGTLHAHLSRYAGNPSSRIQRVGLGFYALKN